MKDRQLYDSTPLDEVESDHLVMQLYKNGAIDLDQIPAVLGAYRDAGNVQSLHEAVVAVAGGSDELDDLLTGHCEDRIAILG